MILLLNAISIKEGGSLVVLRRYLQHFSKLRPDINMHLMLNTSLSGLREIEISNAKIWHFPYIETFPMLIPLWYETILPRLASRIGADVLFSLTNYLPSRLTVPSLLLVQHAGHFSGLFKDLQKNEFHSLGSRMLWRFRNAWVKRSVSTATAVTVQTASLAEAIRHEMNLPEERISVIPHGLGLCNIETTKAYPKAKPIRVGYITKYGVQKNFNVLFEAAARLKKQGTDIRLVLTLDKKIEKNRDVIDSAAHLGLADSIENHGDIAQANIQSLYDSLDIFVFPSLCESFGFPMVEAMSRGLPLLVADIPSNREVGGSAAIPFSPYDEGELSVRITSLLEDEQLYEDASKASISRALSFSWDATARRTLDLLDSLIMA